MQLTQIKNETQVPISFLHSNDKKMQMAVKSVLAIEKYYPKLLEEEKIALKAYMNQNTPLAKDYIFACVKNGVIEIATNDKGEWSFFLSKLYQYLTVHCGFNLKKDNAIILQVQQVVTKMGQNYPSISVYEIFDAIDFCLSRNPELCKSYDSKDGQSSFTAVWLCNIVNYYCTHATSARQIVGQLLAPIEKEMEEKEAIRQSNLVQIKNYRTSCVMVFRNANYFLHENRFDFDLNTNFGGKTYLNWLYENMQVVGLILPSNKEKHPYQAIWDKWKNAKSKTVVDGNVVDGKDFTFDEKIAFSKKEIIESVFKQIPSEMVETETEWVEKYDMLQFAKDLGFFQQVPEMDLGIEMSILKMIEKYGKGIVNIYPLHQHEVEIRSHRNTGIFTQLKQYLNSFHVEQK